MKVTVIGVAGGTGSGKSTLVKRLQEAFKNDDVATLCHDYYYKAHPELTYEERTKLNYDHPQAFDTDLLVDHIKAMFKSIKEFFDDLLKQYKSTSKEAQIIRQNKEAFEQLSKKWDEALTEAMKVSPAVDAELEAVRP